MDLDYTQKQFKEVLNICRELYVAKMHDYGTAWRILRPESVTDQIFIKANRIRTLQLKDSHVGEGIIPEFIGIVNYSIMGLIQLEMGFSETADLNSDDALQKYDYWADVALRLMVKKNHDYDEAWRAMRVSSYVDLILMKIFRTKQIEKLSGFTKVSEGVDANYMDMMNYAIFGLIKLVLEKEDEA